MKKSEIEKLINEITEQKVKEQLQKEQEKNVNLNDNINKNLEQLLKEYPFFKAQLKSIEYELNQLENNGYTIIRKTQNDDIKVQTTVKYKDSIEIIQTRIDNLKKKYSEIKYITDKVDLALDCLRKTEDYYQIIEFVYFEKLKESDILNKMSISSRTFLRAKSSLLQKIKAIIYI